MKLPTADRALYLAISERGLEVTGYPLATSVYDWNWPRGSKNTKRGQLWRGKDGVVQGVDAARMGGNYYGPVPDADTYAAYGGSIDGMYALFGVLSFANEIYTFGEDTDGDNEISQLERIRYQDEHMEGQVFKPWTEYDHPTLGTVEIGGWRKFGQNNPLANDLPREVDRNIDFMLLPGTHHASSGNHGRRSGRPGGRASTGSPSRSPTPASNLLNWRSVATGTGPPLSKPPSMLTSSTCFPNTPPSTSATSMATAPPKPPGSFVAPQALN